MTIERTLIAVDPDDLRGAASTLLSWLRSVQPKNGGGVR